MNKIDNIIKDIENDIEEIKKVLGNKDYNALADIHQYLDGKYQSRIEKWGYSQFGWTDELGFDYKLGTESIISNLKNMIGKLEGYKNELYLESYRQQINPQVFVQNNNRNDNSNTNNINIDFSNLKKNIENNDMMTDTDIREALRYLNTLQKVFESKESKKMKWEKTKEILQWLLGKGVDEAVSYLPAIANMIIR